MKLTSLCIITIFAGSICAVEKCSFHDKECLKQFFQNGLRASAHIGVRTMGIPVLDPYKLANVTISIFGLLNLTLVDGEAVGVGKCILTKYEIDMEEMYKQVDSTCDIIVRGHYVLTPSPILGMLCGWCDIRGEGDGTIRFENWSFKIKYPLKVIKRDGETYLIGLYEHAEHEADVRNVTLKANGLMIGQHDVSKNAVALVNQIWRLVMDSSIGKMINAKAVQYYYSTHYIYFYEVPANQYLIEDLSKYITN